MLGIVHILSAAKLSLFVFTFYLSSTFHTAKSFRRGAYKRHKVCGAYKLVIVKDLWLYVILLLLIYYLW